MSIEYRLIRDEDFEAIAPLEAHAFYGPNDALNAQHLRDLTRPEWTVAAFDHGKPVADVRAMPRERLINGARVPFAIVGPVTCAAAYRRQGHAGKLLKMQFEIMRERGEPITGLYTRTTRSTAAMATSERNRRSAITSTHTASTFAGAPVAARLCQPPLTTGSASTRSIPRRYTSRTVR